VTVRFCRWESIPTCGLARSYRPSNCSSTLGSAPATSSIFTRLRDPATSVTEPWPTPNAAATEASAATVALPSTARSLTRTTRAPSCSPPTPGRADPGRTRTAIRTAPVCAPHAVPSASGPSRHHRPPAHSRHEAYRQPGLRGFAQASGAPRAGLPPCTASGHRVSVRVDRLRVRWRLGYRSPSIAHGTGVLVAMVHHVWRRTSGL